MIYISILILNSYSHSFLIPINIPINIPIYYWGHILYLGSHLDYTTIVFLVHLRAIFSYNYGACPIPPFTIRNNPTIYNVCW